VIAEVNNMERQITLTESALKELVGEAWKSGYYADKSVSMTVQIVQDVKSLVRPYVE
jgi:hypothetical protein